MYSAAQLGTSARHLAAILVAEAAKTRISWTLSPSRDKLRRRAGELIATRPMVERKLDIASRDEKEKGEAEGKQNVLFIMRLGTYSPSSAIAKITILKQAERTVEQHYKLSRVNIT